MAEGSRSEERDHHLGSDSTLTAVQSNTTQAQPHPQSLDTSCGLWTKLLDTTVPRDPSTGPYFNSIYEGYIHFPGSSSDYTAPVAWGELAFETSTPTAAARTAAAAPFRSPLPMREAARPIPMAPSSSETPAHSTRTTSMKPSGCGRGRSTPLATRRTTGSKGRSTSPTGSCGCGT